MRHNPYARVLTHGEKLDVAAEFAVSAPLQADLDAMSDFEKSLIPCAKTLARELGETNPDAYVYYIGWAGKQFLIECEANPEMTKDEVLEMMSK